MAKKPMKEMDDEMEDDSSSAEDSDDEEMPKKPAVKKAKGGIVKGYSRIAKPQRFSGTF